MDLRQCWVPLDSKRLTNPCLVVSAINLMAEGWGSISMSKVSGDIGGTNAKIHVL